jgi:uncharacterized protein
MKMDDALLSFLIADFQSRPLPTVVPRDIHAPMLPGKATTFIGMRRSGKTYAMFDLMNRLLAEGTPREQIVYFNLEDERLGEPDTGTLDRALELFYRRSPSARETRAFVFLDEIQVVPGWERFVRRILATENVQVVLSGSSAKLLSTEIATSLRGYSFAVEVLPFGLRESMRSAGEEIAPAPWPPGAAERSRAANRLDSHLETGGFPEILDAHPFDRVQILQGYAETVMLKDVVERHRVTNLVAMRHLVQALFSSNANEFSVSRLHGTLLAQGVKVSKQTLLEYLGHLTDAYLVFLVGLRTRSEKQRLVNPRKVYAVDPGLAAAMYSGGATNLGAQLENFVYLQIRRSRGILASSTVSYYRTQSGLEVDFAVEPLLAGDRLSLVQACVSLAQPATREREIRALTEAMTETGVDESLIVTMSERESIETPTGAIRVVPAWEWALSQPLAEQR